MHSKTSFTLETHSLDTKGKIKVDGEVGNIRSVEREREEEIELVMTSQLLLLVLILIFQHMAS